MIIVETCPECGHDLMSEQLMTYPPIPRKKCYNCGWSWTGVPEEIVRVPFKKEEIVRVPFKKYDDYININNFDLDNSYKQIKQSTCDGCSNNPKNGGSGICHCILGSMTTTY